MATVNLSDYSPLNLTNADEFHIGIVVSEWNDFVTFNLRDGAIDVLIKEGVKEKNIEVYYVLRGETSHFDYVCSGVAQGIKDCNVLTNTPAVFCVLTDDNKEQSIARSGGGLGNKGIEAGITALKMIGFNKSILG